ncbi:S1C family serine protease [Derxia lacustris]|uniref:S1C family serine protease n=1 Tax=Derxia lacustris TaxID=764842 RepID=UPI000A16F1CB|nr:trypsin-like peptidase domain-containing protein [Derxia lacustris]
MSRRPIQSRSPSRAAAAAVLAPVGAQAIAPPAEPAEPAASAVPAAPRRWRALLRRHERWVWAAALLAVAALAGWAAWLRPLPVVPEIDEIDQALRASIGKKPLASALAAAQAAIAPSVVRIKVEHDEAPAAAARPRSGGAGGPGSRSEPAPARRAPALPPGHPDIGRNPARAPDGAGPPHAPDSGISIGSGVVVTEDGSILTNLHVVSGKGRISVTFADGSESPADLIGADPRIDLAVLRARVLPDDLHAATLRSSHDLLPGQEVLAVGFPFGIGPSTSAGVVSGLDRRFGAPGSDAPMTGLIQFDAAANPGNSGGPLVTLDGNVVGIVTAIMNPTPHETFIGIGFAVPIEAAMGAVGMSPF